MGGFNISSDSDHSTSLIQSNTIKTPSNSSSISFIETEAAIAAMGKPSIKTSFKLNKKKAKFEVKLEFKYNEKLFKVKGIKMKSKIGLLFHFNADIPKCH